MLGASHISYQGILHSTNQSATGGFTEQRSTARSVPKGEEQIGNSIPIPIPIFARRPATMNSFSPTVVDPRRLQISDLHYDKFTTLSTISCWKTRFKTQVSSCSDFPFRGYVMDQRSGDGRFGG